MDNNQQTPAVMPPVNQPVEQQVPAPGASNSQNSKKRTMLLIGGFFVVILLFGYGIFLFFSNSKTSSTNPEPTPTKAIPTPQEEVTQTPDPNDGSFEIVLQKAKKVSIQNSDVNITYVGANIPNPNCFDCSQTTDIVLEKLGEEIKLGYLCGGIAGNCTDKLKGFGLEIELKSANDSSATVRIKKQ